MKERKTKSIENGGFYIALCACILIIALVGYMSGLSSKDEQAPEQQLADNSKTEVYTLPTMQPATAQPATPKPARTAAPTTAAPADVSERAVSSTVTDVEDIPHLITPVKGEVKVEFSGDQLVFNDIVSDWRTHDGVDFTANVNDDVLASGDGVIEDVYSDSLGDCILIDHQNGYKTLYANLADVGDKKAGDEVKKGDVIGKIGETALADFTKEPHLHFEVLADGKNVNPLEYIE